MDLNIAYEHLLLTCLSDSVRWRACFVILGADEDSGLPVEVAVV